MSSGRAPRFVTRTRAATSARPVEPDGGPEQRGQHFDARRLQSATEAGVVSVGVAAAADGAASSSPTSRWMARPSSSRTSRSAGRATPASRRRRSPTASPARCRVRHRSAPHRRRPRRASPGRAAASWGRSARGPVMPLRPARSASAPGQACRSARYARLTAAVGGAPRSRAGCAAPAPRRSWRCRARRPRPARRRHLHTDRIESRPPIADSRLDSGTPITGRSVCAAATPGSAADSPAPAMITRSPRMRAFCSTRRRARARGGRTSRAPRG